MEKLHGHANQTTVYRALEALAETGAVLRVDLGHAHAHYEVARKKDHHHHIICKSCGKIEDIEVCGPRELESTVLKKSKKFSIIKSHALEFFGVCNICVKK
jgi:Fe2+ or Zn2+ uptake regulation protein